MPICICRISWFNVTNLSYCVPTTHQSNSLTNESTILPPRPSSPKPSVLKSKIGTPPRRSMAPHVLATGRYFPKYYIDGDSNWLLLILENWMMLLRQLLISIVQYCQYTVQLITWMCHCHVFFLIATVPQESETLLLGKSVLQSTFSDGHCFRPDFDISVIKGTLIKSLKTLYVICKCDMSF